MSTILATPVAYGLIAVILIDSLFALGADSSAIEKGSLHVQRVLRRKEYYRILSSGFLHRDIAHLLFNVLTLYFFGPHMELLLGSFRFLLLYFGCEIAANLLTLYVQRNNLTYSSIGASGAISGVVSAFCLFEPLAKIYIFFIPIGIPAFIYAVGYIAYSMYAMEAGHRAGIAHEAHLGGAVAGLLLTLLLRPDALAIFMSNFS